jgi:hypothetical protein
MRRYSFVLAALALATVAACSDQTTTGPTAPLAKENANPSPGDTSHYFAGDFTVHGRILGVSATTQPTAGSDTLSFEPLAGAAVRIIRNVLVNGAATQELAAETVSNDDGVYSVGGLPAGYYIVEAAPPSGSSYAAGWSYLAGQASDVKVDVYLWPQK